MIDDAAEFFLLLPADEDVGDALDAVVRDEVLGIALLEDLAGIDEENLALPSLRLGGVQEQDDARGTGVVEEVFRQVEHALDEVAIDEPLADGFFLVVPGISRATGDGPGVPDHCGAAVGLEGGEDVLGPAPVGGGFPGETGSGGEAVELVGIVIRLGEPVLVPHGIGDDAVEGTELPALVPVLRQ